MRSSSDPHHHTISRIANNQPPHHQTHNKRGDRSGYWGYGKEYDKFASLEAYKALVEAGLTFIDTVRPRARAACCCFFFWAVAIVGAKPTNRFAVWQMG
jgi:hypothetical protein